MTAPTPVLPVTPTQPGFLLWVGVDPQRRHHAQELVELAETLGELAPRALPGFDDVPPRAGSSTPTTSP